MDPSKKQVQERRTDGHESTPGSEACDAAPSAAAVPVLSDDEFYGLFVGT